MTITVNGKTVATIARTIFLWTCKIDVALWCITTRMPWRIQSHIFPTTERWGNLERTMIWMMINPHKEIPNVYKTWIRTILRRDSESTGANWNKCCKVSLHTCLVLGCTTVHTLAQFSLFQTSEHHNLSFFPTRIFELINTIE